MAGSAYDRSVFLNVPFDDRYRPLFHALLFAVHDCGFRARCALELDDGSQGRLDKILDLVGSCRYAIHDISRTQLDWKSRLPRFNMPLELGLFLGAKRFGAGEQRRKSCLILDQAPHRYQRFCSDLAGQDVRAHGNRIDRLIDAVRRWAETTPSRRHTTMPGGQEIARRYRAFLAALPDLCRTSCLHPSELSFRNGSAFITAWLRAESEGTPRRKG